MLLLATDHLFLTFSESDMNISALVFPVSSLLDLGSPHIFSIFRPEAPQLSVPCVCPSVPPWRRHLYCCSQASLCLHGPLFLSFYKFSQSHAFLPKIRSSVGSINLHLRQLNFIKRNYHLWTHNKLTVWRWMTRQRSRTQAQTHFDYKSCQKALKEGRVLALRC